MCFFYQSFRISIVLLMATVAPAVAQAQKYDPSEVPRLPSGQLLVEAFVPDRFLLTTAMQTLKLQEDPIGLQINPNISADGKTVVSAHRIYGDPSRHARLVASTYSTTAQRWTDHTEFDGVESIAISPDGSQLACVTRDKELHPHDLVRFRLRVLNLQTGEMTVLRDSSDEPARLSWSPDGRHLAFDMGPRQAPYSQAREIYITQLVDGSTSRLGVGQSASWSPSGEWIAFVSYVRHFDIHHPETFYSGSDYEIRMMRPDGTPGTASRYVMAFHSDVDPNLQPVWSPDSRTLLINTSRDADNGTFEVRMVDLASGKTKTMFKNVAPVYAWIGLK